MKIVVFRQKGEYCCRPDTTLNHNNSDYYCPEGVKALRVVPCVYTHIDKAGKCVAVRFARRYSKTTALGCLISDATEGACESVASSMDFTSVMDMSLTSADKTEEYSFSVNGNKVCSVRNVDFLTRLDEALVDITRLTTLRIGDIIALEAGREIPVKPGDSITMSTAAGNKTIRIF